MLLTADGIRYPDLAVRFPGQDWEYVEVKYGASPLIGRQIQRDQLIQSAGYFSIRGPLGIGNQAPANVNLLRLNVHKY